jgi:UDP-N-acetylmuramoylalanine--D-glutamate ligase
MDWKSLKALRYKSVHVVGLSSVEGSAVAEFLLAQGFRAITAHDFKRPEEFERSYKLVHVGLSSHQRDEAFRRLQSLPLRIHYRDTYLEGIMEADAIFATQAWFLYQANWPKLQEAKEAGIPFHSMTELYFDLAPCPIIAVTGTNGKSTTARLINDILQASPTVTYFAGNDRQNVQVLDKIEEMGAEDVLVLEVSNRQLIDLGRSPHVAVITNVAPNHLDEHPSFEAYVETKRSLIAHQRPTDFAVLNYDNDFTRRMMEGHVSQVFPFSRTRELEEGAFVRAGRIVVRRRGEEREICSVADLRLVGEHNLENVLAAVAASFLHGVDVKTIGQVVSRFRGLKHRIQFVWKMEGVRYYDDLSSTTPQATVAALKALAAPTLLIAGGGDKGLDYGQLGRAIGEGVRVLILLPGQGTEKIEQAVKGVSAEDILLIRHCLGLEEAVTIASELAEPGDAVLLSPACPYFFSMYYLNEKGQEIGFKALLRKMAAARQGR